MKGLVSIIIPVYNTKCYLDECIHSVLVQTYKNVEILLVDDGSTDGSGQICDDFAKYDARIKVIHKKNGGLSDARNAALNVLNGEYIYFLDSDDYIEKDTIEILVNLCEKESADIAITDYTMFSVKTPDSTFSKIGKSLKMNKKEAIRNMLLPGKYDHCACSKLYAAYLWENIRFPVGKLYEDLCVNYDVFEKASTIIYYDVSKYFYRTRPESIMNSSIKVKDLELLDISDEVADKLYNRYPDLEEIITNKRTTTYANLMYRILLCKDHKEFEGAKSRIQKLCRKNLFKCIKSKYMRKNDKIKVLIISINQSIYTFAYQHGKRMG